MYGSRTTRPAAGAHRHRFRARTVGLAVGLAAVLAVLGTTSNAGALLPGGSTTTTPLDDGEPLREAATMAQQLLGDPASLATIDSTSRSGAIQGLQQVIQENPEDSGPAEDAIVAADWSTEIAAQTAAQQQAAAQYQASLAAAEAERAARVAGAPTLAQLATTAPSRPASLDVPAGAPAAKPGWSNLVSGAQSAAAARAAARITSGCDGKVEGSPRSAPPSGTRSGTILSPSDDAFASGDAAATYLGEVRTRIGAGGIREIAVDGHIEAPPIAGATDVSLYAATVLIRQLTTAVGAEPAIAATEYYCYAQDAGATGPVSRGYWRAWVPLSRTGAGAYTLGEPGVLLRSTTHDNGWIGGARTFFLGGDQRYLHLGPSPLPHRSEDGQGVGVNLFPGFLTDDNATAGDDLETAVIRPQFTNIVNQLLPTLSGFHTTVAGPRNKMLKIWLRRVEAGTSNIDVSVEDAADDPDRNEARLRLDIDLRDVKADVYFRSPLLIGAAWLTGCAGRVQADLKLTARVTLDINDGSMTVLEPDVTFSDETVKLHNAYIQTFPFLCNIAYAFIPFAGRKLSEVAKDKLDDPAIISQITQLAGRYLDLSQLLSPSFTLPNGSKVNLGFQGFADTCQPYGCNAPHGGDIGTQHHGMEALASFVVTDGKAASAPRRFPASYRPTSDSIRSVITQHYSADGEIYDATAAVSPGLVNQALRTVAEGGLADVSVAGLAFQSRSAPFLSRWSGLASPVGLVLPSTDVTVGSELYGVTARAAAGLRYDAPSGVVSPGTVSVSGAEAAVSLMALRCGSYLWLSCVTLPAAASTVVNSLASSLLQPLLDSTIGKIRVPQLAGMTIGGLHLDNVGGNLVIRGSIGAAQLHAWSWNNPSNFGFTETWEGLPGTGSPSFSWAVRDNTTWSLLASGPTIPSIFPTSSLTWSTQGNGRGAWAIVSASRGGSSLLAAASFTQR